MYGRVFETINEAKKCAEMYLHFPNVKTMLLRVVQKGLKVKPQI